MSSSDDPFDKKLRTHFQDVFDNFDRPPSASLKERIWQQLTEPIGADRQYGLLLLGLLIGTGFFYHKYDSKLRSYQLKVDEAKTVHAHQPIDPDWQPASKQVQLPQNTKKLSSASWPVETPVRKMPLKQDRLVLDRQPTERNGVPKQRSVGIRTRLLTVVTTDTVDSPTAHQAQVRQQTPHSETELPTLRAETPEIQLATSSVHPKTIEEVGAGASVSWQLLQSLPMQITGNLPAQINRKIDVQASATSERPSLKPKTPVRWLVSVTPLSTYQLMTVVDKPNTYVQRVDVPAAFSGSTWGYQLRAGIEWRQYDIDLSFGQIRRWAYYDLATNSFQVQPVGRNQYEVTRLEQPVAENVSLSILGASLNKQYKLGGVQSRYVARLGGAISYLPDTHQSLMWAKAMVGATFPLAKVYQLQVGPTVEYGFSRVWSTERQLIIRPYLVGAAITLRPNKP